VSRVSMVLMASLCDILCWWKSRRSSLVSRKTTTRFTKWWQSLLEQPKRHAFFKREQWLVWLIPYGHINNMRLHYKGRSVRSILKNHEPRKNWLQVVDVIGNLFWLKFLFIERTMLISTYYKFQIVYCLRIKSIIYIGGRNTINF
jgi:hypothetical protein